MSTIAYLVFNSLAVLLAAALASCIFVAGFGLGLVAIGKMLALKMRQGYALVYDAQRDSVDWLKVTPLPFGGPIYALASSPEDSTDLAIQTENGDPVQNLAELLGSMPGSQEDWEALIYEPY